jgi:hypothetical protein
MVILAAIQQIDAAIAGVNGALTTERGDQIKGLWLVNFTPAAFTAAIAEGIVKKPT